MSRSMRTPASDELRSQLVNGCAPKFANRHAGRHSVRPRLAETRSGKIMRRILRKIAENELDALGDTSPLADPGVVDDLVANRVGGI